MPNVFDLTGTMIRGMLEQGAFVPFLGAGASSISGYEVDEKNRKTVLLSIPNGKLKCIGDLRKIPGECIRHRIGRLLQEASKEQHASDPVTLIDQIYKSRFPSGKNIKPFMREQGFYSCIGERYIYNLNYSLIKILLSISDNILRSLNEKRSFLDLNATTCFDISPEFAGKIGPIFGNALVAVAELKKLFENDQINLCQGARECWRDEQGACKSAIIMNLQISKVCDSLLAFAYLFTENLDPVSWEKIQENWGGEIQTCRTGTYKDIFDEIGAMGTKNRKYRYGHYQWLTDLFWHTVRFDDSVLPTAQEIAFRLSLNFTRGVLMPGELAQAAEVTGLGFDLPVQDEDQAFSLRAFEIIKNWFEYSNSYSKGSYNCLHKTVALMMKANYEYIKIKHSDQQRSLPHHLEVNVAHNKRLCAAVTTNWDNCLEYAISEASPNSKCSVIFPISIKYEIGTKFHWCISEVEFIKNGPNKYRATDTAIFIKSGTDIIEIKEKISSIKNDFLVIKLHGSPLYNIPENAVDGLTQGKEEIIPLHALVISESGYLSYLQNIDDSSIDGVIKELLTSVGYNKYLFFLGYSLSDWNMRLSLYKHALLEKEAVREAKKYAVLRSIDPYKVAIMNPLDVKYTERELVKACDIFLGQCLSCNKG
jgi:hypothetical protein